MQETGYQTIDEYIEQYPADMAARLSTLRETIHNAAPEAAEKISWRMPTFYYHGNLVHFAAFKKHISLFPGAEGVAHFQDRLAGYHFSKGGIQFPNDQPLPLDLVTDIVCFRYAQNKSEAEAKNTR